MIEISVIIPAYNEQERIVPTLASIHDFLSSGKRNFEILVVNDGSRDDTTQMVEKFAQGHPQVKGISYLPNKGKGFAVRTGVLAAQGQLILLDDADGSSPISELPRLEKAVREGSDIAIGSRNIPNTDRMLKALSHRKHMGNTFNAIVQKLLLPGIYDTQCGFKLFRGDVAKELFSNARLDGFAFDVEVLYLARLNKLIISEVAIDWANVDGSKVRVIRDSARMLRDVLSIRAMKAAGRYKHAIRRVNRH